jgi:hypothetical protein
VIDVARAYTRAKQLAVTFEISDATIYARLKPDPTSEGPIFPSQGRGRYLLASTKRRTAGAVSDT